MEKFSLYEFMSYFLPGVVTVLLLHKVANNLLDISQYGDVVEGVILTTAAIICGLVVHAVTFCLSEYEFYKALIMRPIALMAKKNKNIANSVTVLKSKYNKEGKTDDELFNEAYYFLEYIDKITMVKSFQSIYFFLRNCVTILFCTVLVLLFFLIFQNVKEANYLQYTLLSFSLMLMLMLTANFYRNKMTERLLGTYVAALNDSKKSSNGI